MEVVKTTKLVNGGQGLAELLDGRKVFVWGALPDETVEIELTKSKRNYAEAVATKILEPSTDRIEPLEPEIFLSTSPWQIMNYSAENIYKQQLLNDAFATEKLIITWQDFYAPAQRFGYRNKMEYNFWWDNTENKISLALHIRGSHRKIPVTGSELATTAINQAGARLINFLNDKKLEARSLKSVILRSQADGQVAACIYVNDESLAQLDWSILGLKSLKLFLSNPKSPASVASKTLLSLGSEFLEDRILNQQFAYAPEGFFQVNLDPYEAVLREIQQHVTQKPLVDLYSGVGSIGLSVAKNDLTCVELDKAAAAQAKLNADRLKPGARVVVASSEASLDYISADPLIVVDPPRAGLHKKVVDRLLDSCPERIIYLSCNPATQARDVSLLSTAYRPVHARGYNFFPATPHIESLVVLDKL